MKRLSAVLAGTIVVAISVSPVGAAMPPHGKPTLVVRLDADGSLTLTQRGSDAAPVITLPSIQALPAEIDALIPRTAERKQLAISADSKGPYRNLLKAGKVAEDAGFDEFGILESEKGKSGEFSELAVGFRPGQKFLPSDKTLFVSLGDDGDVLVSLGIPGIAKSPQERDVKLGSAPDAIIGLVPKGRPRTETYLRADFGVPIGDVMDFLRKLQAIGLKNITIIGEATE